MLPGQYVLIFGTFEDALAARKQGLSLRDTVLVQLPEQTLTVYLFRKPIEGTVAQNMLKYGCGGLDIDGCRVEAKLSEFFSSTGKPRSGLGHARGYGMGEGYGGDRANSPNKAGRWPPNLLLVHGPECIQEEACQPNCPVFLLDKQVGILTSGKPQGVRHNALGYHGSNVTDSMLTGYGDTGKASRFFPQFSSLSEAKTWLSQLVGCPAEVEQASLNP